MTNYASTSTTARGKPPLWRKGRNERASRSEARKGGTDRRRGAEELCSVRLRKMRTLRARPAMRFTDPSGLPPRSFCFRPPARRAVLTADMCSARMRRAQAPILTNFKRQLIHVASASSRIIHRVLGNWGFELPRSTFATNAVPVLGHRSPWDIVARARLDVCLQRVVPPALA